MWGSRARSRSPAKSSWILLAGVAVAALVVGLFVTLGGGTSEGTASTGPRSQEAAARREGRTTELASPAEVASPDTAQARPAEERRRRETEAADPETAASGEPFRGILLDAATDEPIPEAWLQARSIGIPVGEDGRFATNDPLPPYTQALEFHDRFHGTHIRTLGIDHLEPSPDGWIARIAIGPTYRVRIAGVDARGLEGWRGRLVEVRERGPAVVGDLVPIRPRDPPWFRYDNPWEPADPGSTYRIEVENVGGTLRGSAPVESAVGIHAEVVIDPNTGLGAMRGRVVDASRRPQDGVELIVIPKDGPITEVEGELRAETTGEDGEFEFLGLATGDHVLYAKREGFGTVASWDVFVPPGDSRLDDLIVPGVGQLGRVAGTLESRSGNPMSGAYLRLVSMDGSYDRWIRATAGLLVSTVGSRQIMLEQSTSKLEFSVHGIPLGSYELSVYPEDGFTWTPAIAEITVPAEGLLFRRNDTEPTTLLVFEAADAATGEPIEELEVLLEWPEAMTVEPLRAERGEAFIEVPRETPFGWTAQAPGYRPASGDEADFEGTGERKTARPRLSRGWGARLHLRDAAGNLDVVGRWSESSHLAMLERPPVPDARILADGKEVARTDDRGTARLDLDAEPDSIEIAAPGWRVLGPPELHSGRIQDAGPEVVIWLLRVE